jgi:organic hydroperoxide reductase OsmC/OhrA
MSEYNAKVVWTRGAGEQFIDSKYSRGHTWIFDGGTMVPASSSPHVVPLPYSIEANVDPEEAFIASLSSCHMLFFLSIAAKNKFVVERYTDDAVGVMEKNSRGRLSITRVTLRPKIVFSGDVQPTKEIIEKIHHQSHQQCYIVNSVKTIVSIEIVS